MKKGIRIENRDGVSYNTIITDIETGKRLENVARIELDLQANVRAIEAKLTLHAPVLDIIADAEIKHICPCCGKSTEIRTHEQRYHPELFAPVGEGRTMQEMVLDALTIGGTHHKQWYLWRIAEALEIDTSEIEGAYKGIAP